MSESLRVGIVFDDQLRPDTTGTHCLRALKQFVDVTHILPNDLHRIAPDAFDFFLSIDDGLDYQWPTRLRPAGYWAIDTHMDLTSRVQKANGFDLVYAAQRDGAQQFQLNGIERAKWLPLACDEELHRGDRADKRYDVCFVGNLVGSERVELLQLLCAAFPNHFVGQRYLRAMTETYSASRIVFNRSVKNDVNMRIFEALASGSLLITNDLAENGLSEQFQDGVHLATYKDADELLDKVAYYLRHAGVRERIATAGQRLVLQSHTYLDRMRTIIADATTMKTANTSNGPRAGYFDFTRPELLALVRTDVRRVLEVGCGTGRLGASIKERQSARVTGIELDATAAALARQRLDHVVVGDVEEHSALFEGESFDCIICGDVLEHLSSPFEVLQTLRRWLTPDGQLIASLPNARNHSLITGLLEGNWTYESAGLLDQTHLHFFTRRDIERLLYRAGFGIELMDFVPGPGFNEWRDSDDRGRLELGSLCITGLPEEEAEEFFVYQYLVVARKDVTCAPPLTSIIIVTHNALEYTRQCVASLIDVTDEPYELIFVDNGSTDGTLEYLRSLGDIVLIENPDNRGFPSAVNQGLAAATGDQLLLLNNDVVLTVGWLRRLSEVLQSSTQVGLVGPITNCTSGPQRVDISYRELDMLEAFAWSNLRAQAGVIEETQVLMGFCLLIRRSVLSDIGMFDERFGIGLFEDVDFSRRAIAAGYKALIVRDVFVHHFGHQTFAAAQIDMDSLAEKSAEQFVRKWGTSHSSLTPESASCVSGLIRLV